MTKTVEPEHPCNTRSQATMRNPDGTVMLNEYGETIYQAQFLNSHPLKRDCKERTGPNGMVLTYVTGSGVIRDLNSIFGHGNWSTEITMTKEIMSVLSDEGRWNVGYVASVKLTLLSTGASHEDVGSGEATNENKLKAHEIALKSATTDAMKRSARHFGERLGNALYRTGSSLALAPKDNKTALQHMEWNHGLDFGNQAELCERKEKGHSFPPKPGSKEAIAQTATKLSKKSVTNQTNLGTQHGRNHDTQNHQQQQLDIKQQGVCNLPLSRVSFDSGRVQGLITPMQVNYNEIDGYVRASDVHVPSNITPQSPHFPVMIPSPPPLPRYAPLNAEIETSPACWKRPGSDLSTPTAKRFQVGKNNPYL